MANEVKVTLGFESKGAIRQVGWSEILYFRTSPTDLLDGLPDAERMARIRCNLLGGGYFIKFIRLSREGVFRDSRLSKQCPMFPNGSPSTGTATGDFAQLALNIRMESDNLNRRFMYLSGSPDSICEIGSLPTDPAWILLYNNWTSEILSTWAYLGLQKQANGHPVEPHVKTLYPIRRIVMNEWSSRKRGRPFKLYRGRGPDLEQQA